MSKIYETPEDREAEERALMLYAEKFGFNVLLTPTLSEIDGICHRGGMTIGLVEFKRRHNKSDKYPTLEISSMKLDHGVLTAEAMGVPASLLIEWDDTLGWWVFDRDRLSSTEKKPNIGRTDRADAKDIEQGYCIPMGEFRML